MEAVQCGWVKTSCVLCLISVATLLWAWLHFSVALENLEVSDVAGCNTRFPARWRQRGAVIEQETGGLESRSSAPVSNDLPALAQVTLGQVFQC